MAAQVFNLFTIQTVILQGIIQINNFIVAIIVGLIGLWFFRKKLKQLETDIESQI